MNQISITCQAHRMECNSICTHTFCNSRILCKNCECNHIHNKQSRIDLKFYQDNCIKKQINSLDTILLSINQNFSDLKQKLIKKKQEIISKFQISFQEIKQKINKYMDDFENKYVQDNSKIFDDLLREIENVEYQIQKQKLIIQDFDQLNKQQTIPLPRFLQFEQDFLTFQSPNFYRIHDVLSHHYNTKNRKLPNFDEILKSKIQDPIRNLLKNEFPTNIINLKSFQNQKYDDFLQSLKNNNQLQIVHRNTFQNDSNHQDCIKHITWIDWETIATSSFDSLIKVSNIQSGKNLMCLQQDLRQISSLIKINKRLISSIQGNSIYLWNLYKKKMLLRYDSIHKDDFIQIFLLNQSLIIAVDCKLRVIIWNFNQQQVIGKLALPLLEQNSFNAARIHVDKHTKLILIVVNKYTFVLNTSNFRIIKVIFTGISDIIFSKFDDQKHLLLISQQVVLQLDVISTHFKIKKQVPVGDICQISEICQSNLIACITSKNEIYIINLQDFKIQNQIKLGGKKGYRTICYLNDGMNFAVSTADFKIKIYGF